jgi:hypothetical protein
MAPPSAGGAVELTLQRSKSILSRVDDFHDIPEERRRELWH